MLRFALITATVLALTACGDSLGPTSAIDGSWSGSASGGSASLTLTEANHTISGNGNLSDASGALAVTVTGTHTAASVSMTWSAQGYEPINFTGTVGSDGLSMSGTLNGSGFQNFALTLTRPKP